MATPRRSVLITGCSEGGMGFFVAKEFARKGWRVFATLRTPSKGGDLASTPNIEVLPLDVVSSDSIAECVKTVTEKTGGKLDCLYNNSGAQFVMPMPDTNIDEAKKLFDVNVWGLLAVTQGFLPLLVAAKGLIANAGSIRANLMQPYDGVYGMSKAAVEMLSWQMELEFQPLGVRVLAIHIGGVNTHIFDKQATGAESGVSLPANSLYRTIESTIVAIAGGASIPKSGIMSAEDFARRIVGDISGGKTGETWRGGYATVTRILSPFLPRWVLSKMAADKSGLDIIEKEFKTGSKV